MLPKHFDCMGEDEVMSWNDIMALVIAGPSCGFIDASLETSPRGD